MAIDVMKESGDLVEAIRFFRVGMEGFANKRLASFIESYIARMPSLPEDVVATSQLLFKEMREAQERHDYIWLADLMEFELFPVIYPGMSF